MACQECWQSPCLGAVWAFAALHSCAAGVATLSDRSLAYRQPLVPGFPLVPNAKESDAGGVSSGAQTTKIGELSEGQKSRLVFGMICMQRPNLLLLDEPTNHLDLESIDALADAIKAYKGGLVLVSHDFRLIDQVRCPEHANNCPPGLRWWHSCECGPRDSHLAYPHDHIGRRSSVNPPWLRRTLGCLFFWGERS